jgi:hypothetical protein
VTDYKFGPEENKMAQLGTADTVMDFASDFTTQSQLAVQEELVNEPRQMCTIDLRDFTTQ